MLALTIVWIDDEVLDIREEGVQGVEGVELPETFEEEVEDGAADDGGGLCDGGFLDLRECEEEGAGVFGRDKVPDDEGEDGEDGGIGEAGVGVELHEREERDFAGC